MREGINGHPVIRSIKIDTGDPIKVYADDKNLYVPQVIIHHDQKVLYYLEISKELLKEGVSNLDDQDRENKS